MASYNQVMNMGAGQPMTQTPLVPTARPASPTGGAPPLLGQAMAGMQPGQMPFGTGTPGMGPAPDPMDELAKQLDGPEIANLFGPQGLPSLSLMDLMRLLQMHDTWNAASAPYGAIL